MKRIGIVGWRLCELIICLAIMLCLCACGTDRQSVQPQNAETQPTETQPAEDVIEEDEVRYAVNVSQIDISNIKMTPSKTGLERDLLMMVRN